MFHDRTGIGAQKEINLTLDQFPSPADLWERYRAWKGLTADEEKIVLQDYFDDASGKAPRCYQVNAVNAAIEAIAKGQNRVLLVMAIGTGKTYTAFQIIWRLWKAGRKKRILFLADRNVLVDQTMVNDFRPFGPAMAKLSTGAKTIEREDGCEVELTTALDRKRRIDTAYEVYLGLYQAITGPEERQKLFREFSPGFFDLIVIDECHRGSAAEDSAWREILDYFSSATQIGLTATPKETEYVSNIHYFGKPVYTYSLKQGIQDGFLAPYKVVKVHIDVDVEGYRPERGEVDRYGNEIEDRIYNAKDFDRTLVIDDRTKLVVTSPPIWRRLLVPADLTLAQLHDVLQAAMGWQECHMHEFSTGGRHFGRPNPEDRFMGMPPVENERTVRLSRVLSRVGAKAVYTYDFGDSWEHGIVLEKRLCADPTTAYPVCTGGELACPPEDCGGIGGFYDLLDALRDPAHEQHDEMYDWVGDDYDPDAFSIDDVNRMLTPLRRRRIKPSRNWSPAR